MSSKPTILWIHGGWHTPKHFQPIIDLFEEAGYPSVCPHQPSVGHPPPVGLKEDAQCIHDELNRLVQQEGKDVLVIAHSYGGMVANEGIGQDFSKQTRMRAGQPGGVVRIIFLAAFAVSKGSSLLSPLGGRNPPGITVNEHGMASVVDPRNMFYHDLSAAEQDHWVDELLPIPSAPTQRVPLTQVCYQAHPLTYVHTLQDRGNPYELQQSMIHDMGEQYSVSFDTDVIDSSHSPYLSKPNELLAIVERQIASAKPV